MTPKYTVVTNLVSPETKDEKHYFVGTSWEFFTDPGAASLCYQRHVKAGNIPTLRPFHKNDIPHMGIVDREALS